MADGLNRFLGDTPGRTVIKLIVVSLVVGFVMNAFGLSAMDIVNWVHNFFLDIWHSGFAALGRIGDYLLIGAAVVVPAYVLIRVLSWRKS